ncbi:hemerythrin domain-containing protein [Aureibaculum luteum]|uniref:hemerythrin domain-containing protein n=1 Tax=Aureibaculum luteum TaxID=1548456 RepID=UPI000E54C892|nr:hemerythrin domain-containing protein [Aureibaculum luteum]
MTSKKPLKRVKELQFLSREHHHTLLLSWKIRTGFQKGVNISIIKQYVDWFYNHHIKQHFNMEELHIFPILGDQHELVKKAISEHKRLKILFTTQVDIEKSLSLLEEELEQHVRFEERILFKQIQEIATDQQLKMIDAIHTEEVFIDNTSNEFWK